MLSRYLLALLFDAAAVALFIIGAYVGLHMMPGFIPGLLCLAAFSLLSIAAHAAADNLAA